MPSFWKLRTLAQPKQNERTASQPHDKPRLIAFVFVERVFGNQLPKSKSPTNGSQVAYREISRTPCCSQGMDQLVWSTITKVSVAGFNPGVIDDIWTWKTSSVAVPLQTDDGTRYWNIVSVELR